MSTYLYITIGIGKIVTRIRGLFIVLLYNIQFVVTLFIFNLNVDSGYINNYLIHFIDNYNNVIELPNLF